MKNRVKAAKNTDVEKVQSPVMLQWTLQGIRCTPKNDPKNH